MGLSVPSPTFLNLTVNIINDLSLFHSIPKMEVYRMIFHCPSPLPRLASATVAMGQYTAVTLFPVCIWIFCPVVSLTWNNGQGSNKTADQSAKRILFIHNTFIIAKSSADLLYHYRQWYCSVPKYTRSCCMVSRLRKVTQLSSKVWWLSWYNTYPMASWRRCNACRCCLSHHTGGGNGTSSHSLISRAFSAGRLSSPTASRPVSPEPEQQAISIPRRFTNSHSRISSTHNAKEHTVHTDRCFNNIRV